MKSIVENFDLFAPKLVDKEEYYSSGHRACQGCGEALAIRLMAKALGKDTVVTNATGCMEVTATPYPTTAWKLPWVHVAFPNSASVHLPRRQHRDFRPDRQVFPLQRQLHLFPHHLRWHFHHFRQHSAGLVPARSGKG